VGGRGRPPGITRTARRKKAISSRINVHEAQAHRISHEQANRARGTLLCNRVSRGTGQKTTQENTNETGGLFTGNYPKTKQPKKTAASNEDKKRAKTNGGRERMIRAISSVSPPGIRTTLCRKCWRWGRSGKEKGGTEGENSKRPKKQPPTHQNKKGLTATSRREGKGTSLIGLNLYSLKSAETERLAT